MSNLLEYLKAHHAAIAYTGGGILAALNIVITYMLKIESLQDWVAVAEKNPRIAALVRLLGAVGIQPIPVLQALIDLIRGTASPGTLASAKTLAVSSSTPIIAPANQGIKK